MFQLLIRVLLLKSLSVIFKNIIFPLLIRDLLRYCLVLYPAVAWHPYPAIMESRAMYLTCGFNECPVIATYNWMLHNMTDIDQYTRVCLSQVLLPYVLWINGCCVSLTEYTCTTLPCSSLTFLKVQF